MLPPGLHISVQMLLLLLLVERGPAQLGAGGWALVCSRVLAGLASVSDSLLQLTTEAGNGSLRRTSATSQPSKMLTMNSR